MGVSFWRYFQKVRWRPLTEGATPSRWLDARVIEILQRSPSTLRNRRHRPYCLGI